MANATQKKISETSLEYVRSNSFATQAEAFNRKFYAVQYMKTTTTTTATTTTTLSNS